MIRALLANPRRAVKTLLGRDFFLYVDTRVAYERLGSAKCAWDIVTANLRADSVVYSFGVGRDASFDLALIERFGVTVHAFDPTPGSIAWVEQQRFPPKFVMHGYGIAAADGDVTFYPPDNPDFISHSILDHVSTKANAITVPVKSLRTILKESGHRSIDVLKMDIEGAEYEVLTDLLDSDIRPGQILVEFHHRFEGVGMATTQNAVRRLREAGYRLFSVTPALEEFCFIR